MSEIIRSATQEEKRDFTDIGSRDFDARKKFETELGNKMQEAAKKGLPFAAKACRDEFNDYYKREVEKSVRKNGYFEPSDVKALKVDFNHYMDLKNFELMEEGERSDGNLTKHNPGLDVKAAYKVYKYNGYANTYTVMESGPDSILRARAKLRELEAETPKKKVK